ncbi:MAG TPA: hypothetical protein VGM80_14175 [Gaiellaceae bacterium]|jgi:glyoxylase-like metal-dependent hydrolase (beta-lactamase superfamily II)
MEATEVAPDLWRWTGRVESIGAEAASTYIKSDRTIALVDPILPPEDEDGFWRALDRDVRPIEASVHVVLTSANHTRQAAEMLARYPQSRLWAHREIAGELDAAVTDVFEHGDPLPAGLTSFASGRPGESLLWLAEHRTLLVGDALAGSDRGLVLRSPEGAVAGALRELPVTDIDRVLPSHGTPVLEGAAAQLERLLADHRNA